MQSKKSISSWRAELRKIYIFPDIFYSWWSSELIVSLRNNNHGDKKKYSGKDPVIHTRRTKDISELNNNIMLEISWSEPAGYVSITPGSVNGPNKDLIHPRRRRGDYVKERRLYFNEREG